MSGLKNFVYIHSGILFRLKEDWNFVACRQMNRIGDHNVKWSKPRREIQRSYVFSHMWKLELKDKGIYEYIHDHICIYLYRETMFVIVGMFERTRGRWNKKVEW
jgi:hypothetical protein